jgi:CheY-like chemotaxis protein
MDSRPIILLVDDSENDLLLMRMAFKKAEFDVSFQEAHNGEEAIAYLRGDGPYSDRTKFPLPLIMLLDLNMPRKSGFDVLTWVRAEPGLKRLSIFVLTASMLPGDIERAFDSGANAYLVKPSSLDALVAMTRSLRDWIVTNHFPRLDA